MANGYSRSPKLMKGALIRFSKSLLVPIPNVIVFQYNPETIKRSFAVSELSAVDKVNTDELSQPYDPRETISLTLELDATDALEEPASHPVAVIYGVADRIAAMEVLLYPVSTEPASQLNVALSASVSASGVSVSKKETVPPRTVPVVLLFLGPGRIVPVRITDFSVDEQAFSPLLYPIRATVTLGVKVIDPAIFGDNDKSATANIARACYAFTRGQKDALALANLANSAESMGMLPI
jgi:hypothetical protein